jgi:hypothetical protein
MFVELHSGDSAQQLVVAADPELTMVVARHDESLREILQEIGMRDFRYTFLVVDSDVFAAGQEQRWFGADPNDVLAVLRFDVPDRTAFARFPGDADPFDIGQAVLHAEKEGK